MYFKSIYEEIASLYLRLNCFFVNPCYVIETGEGQSLEIDLIAVRRRGAVEVVNNEELYLDSRLFEKIGSKRNGKEECRDNYGEIDGNRVRNEYDIVIIGEVKSRKDLLWRSPKNDDKMRKKITYSLSVLGVTKEHSKGSKIVESLMSEGRYIDSSSKTIVLLMGFAPDRSRRWKGQPEWRDPYYSCYLFVPIEYVFGFIIERIKRYKSLKRRAQTKYYYPSLELLLLITKHLKEPIKELLNNRNKP